ncbi:MAG: NAD-glutamate dehydrogenase [Alphaproteobacteria bacterium]
MNAPSASLIPQAVEQAVAGNESLLPHTHLIQKLATQLFANEAGIDTDVTPLELLAKLAVSTFEFFAERDAGAPKIRAYNVAEGDSQTPFTIIELVNDDMPFLLSSVLAELVRSKIDVKFVTHPILCTQRNTDGRIENFTPRNGDTADCPAESVLHIHVEEQNESTLEKLLAVLRTILEEVHIVVDDWQPMLERVKETAEMYVTSPPPVGEDELKEAVRFLSWIRDDNMLLLGVRHYNFIMAEGKPDLEPRPETGLGLLRDSRRTVLRPCGSTDAMSKEAAKFFTGPATILITKGNFLSPVQRRVPVDSIGVKLYDAEGKLTGELRIVGLFAAAAYNDSVRHIPLLKHKVSHVLSRLGSTRVSYSGRMLLNILESFPRDEMFQIKHEQLADICQALLELELMPRTRVFTRRDIFRRYVSVLVYVNRERFSTGIRERIAKYLADEYDGYVTDITPVFSLGPLVRLHVVIWKECGGIPDVDAGKLEKGVAAIIRTWSDKLHCMLRDKYGSNFNGLLHRYAKAFPPDYEHTNQPERALEDIQRLEKLSPATPVGIDFFSDPNEPANELRVMLYQLDEPIPLSKRVPMLEHFGFSVISESTFEVSLKNGSAPQTVFLHDMALTTSNGQPIDLPAHDLRLEESFLAVWNDKAGDDFFNGLVFEAELTWREAALMRAYGSYLRQIGAPFSLTYLAKTLIRHGEITKKLVALFHTLFDPTREGDAEARLAEAQRIAAKVEVQLEAVSSLDEDRMIRRYLNLIQATNRTNFYQTPTELTGGHIIALKIDSAKVDGMPAPKPFAEIFVTNPRFEGIHLRGGPIARGGLRWSDRPQDFRTEILGLAKAQHVKNAIIVPQGAKGGFVPRRIAKDTTREAMMAEGIACYRSFVANLLSVTDNLKDGQPIPPDEVFRLDSDDPYLVVAADKGTASFSNIANSVSVEHGFWLDDAFASGGSAGYDHKAMGITARGGWEAVKRHFREMNTDIQTTPFRAIGVGDMSGDVFGNAMLLSKQIKLVAAFDHRDIFLDPDPAPAASWDERKRLFDMPRSSWQDYNRELISEGGGVFSRTLKKIPLSASVQAMLGTAATSAPPAEVIRLILKAQADLLWFGGIGTYIRASGETDDDANDRTNDSVRITAAEAGVKVIGEGANLGLTQRARIEFARKGGRINTDAIDNSAGVNTSDVEVNIKIALAAAERAGRLTRDDRNAVLAAMTDEVAQDVLINNYQQTLAISLTEKAGFSDLGFQSELMHSLEETGLLDRTIERLPSDSELAEHRKKQQALTRPELAVLLAYAKIGLYFELMKSPILEDTYFNSVLTDYFPKTMRERFTVDVEQHPLRREIIATVMTNAAINRGGSTFTVRLQEETGREAGEIAAAFAAAMDVFQLGSLFDAVDALDNKIDGGHQLDLYTRLQNVLRRQTAWFLRHGRIHDGLSTLIERYRNGINTLNAAIESIFDEWLTGRLEDSVNHFLNIGIPPELARRFAHLTALFSAHDIISLAVKLDKPELEVAQIYFQVSSHFRLEEVHSLSEGLEQTDYFTRLAINSALESAASAQRAIVKKVFTSANGAGASAADFTAWCEQNAHTATRARHSFDALLNGSELTLAKLTVAVAHLRELSEQ